MSGVFEQRLKASNKEIRETRAASIVEGAEMASAQGQSSRCVIRPSNGAY